MTDTINVKPASPAADIPDPARGNARLPYTDAGVIVPRDAYWMGLVAQGDVVLVPPPSPFQPAPRPAVA